MLTDKDCVDACASIYDPASKWDRLWSAGIYAGIRGNILCFRGSVTLDDWLDDADAAPFNDPDLGGVHAGFFLNLKEFHSEICQYLGPHPVIVGHSLGAARAALFSALLAAKGHPPAAAILFGCPRPGFLKAIRYMTEFPMRSYKNRCDPVTDVPLPFYPDFPYMDAPGRIQVNATDDDIAELEADPKPWADFEGFLEHITFRDHHIELYQRVTPATEIAT
jgi:Lipase (class 3)